MNKTKVYIIYEGTELEMAILFLSLSRIHEPDLDMYKVFSFEHEYFKGSVSLSLSENKKSIFFEFIHKGVPMVDTFNFLDLFRSDNINVKLIEITALHYVNTEEKIKLGTILDKDIKVDICYTDVQVLSNDIKDEYDRYTFYCDKYKTYTYDKTSTLYGSDEVNTFLSTAKDLDGVTEYYDRIKDLFLKEISLLGTNCC